MEKIALLPGGFKPPHAGHYNMAKWLAANTDADSIVIKIGSKERDGITRDISLKLWDLYRKADEDSGKLVIVPSEQNSPVRDVYDFIEQDAPEGSTVYLGMGEKDIEDQRFKNIGKFAEPKGIEFKTVLVPPQAGGVSGTEMRGFISSNDKDSFQKYLPDHLTPEQKEKAWKIVTTKSEVEEDFYDPKNKTVDFMRSSEWKAGYRGKKDIPRKGDQIHNRQTSPVSWEENLKEQQGKVLRVYDFDDTLAVTKGANIKVKHTDGSIDTLNPAEFATYAEQEGDKFDFTEFDRVIKDAEPIQNIVSMLRKDLETTAKVTILTARLMAYPVRRYLRTAHGLDAYVVAVGSSDPQDKSNWIKNHIEKGYNDILFIDDSEKNRNAVLSLKDEYPDIKLDVQDPDNVKEAMMGTMNNQEKAKHYKNLKRLKKDLKKQGNQYMEVPKYLNNTLTRKIQESAAATIEGEFIPLEIMDTPELQVQGMMGRNKLKGGMVFPYDEIQKRIFHTKDCKISLDILFISNNKINKIYHSCPPCQEKICPKYSGKADNVLELPGGYCKDNNIKAGNKIGLNLTKPPKPLFMTESRLFSEGISNKIFVMKSPHTPKGQEWDHIGFVLDDGRLRDMSGHRGSDKSPETYKYEDTEELFQMPKSKEEAIKNKLYAEKELPKEITIPDTIACDIKDPTKKAENCGSFVKIVLSNNGIETTKSNWMDDIFDSIPEENIEENIFTKLWWKKLLIEGGAAGHMAHPFNLNGVNSGKDLLDIFNKASNSLQTNPGSVKIDGVNSSIRLIDLDGTKQFVMDRGSKKELDIKGITKDELEARFGEGHGMIKIGGEVLDMFNEALPSLKSDLEKLGAWDNPNILFNMEYVSGKTNVQDYGSNFIAIHGLNQIESKEVQGKRKMLTKRVSSEISYSKDDLQSLLDNLAPIAKNKGFEVYGSVPTEMTKSPDFNSALSKTYNIKKGEEIQNKSLKDLLNELNNIPEKDFIFMNVDGSQKKVGAVSKQVYLSILKENDIDELFESEEDKQKAIEGFTTYLATEKLGDEVLKVLDSPMGSVENHEGVVIRDKSISNEPFKITGKFILGGMASDF